MCLWKCLDLFSIIFYIADLQAVDLLFSNDLYTLEDLKRDTLHDEYFLLLVLKYNLTNSSKLYLSTVLK